MTFRKCLFWIHLTAGSTAGLVILIMSVTAVLLTYEKQILAWADRDPRTAAPSARAERLPVEALLAAVRNNSGAVPSSITLRADADEPATVTLPGGPLGQATLVNAYTGQMLGPQSVALRGFFAKVTDWHRWLGTTIEGRNGARSITGAANLLFLFLVASGLYLWFPRKWRWPNFRAVMWFRGGLAGKARDFNWHNVAGFWCCVPLFFLVLSGVVMSYPWASDMVYRAAGSQPPQLKGRGGPPKGLPPGALKGGARGGPRGGAFGRGPQPEVNLAGLNLLMERAEAQMPGWQSINLRIPQSDAAPVTFSIDASLGGQPQKRVTLTLDRQSGAVRNLATWESQDAGARARTWMRFVHTGEYYGVAGQTIAGIASAGGALLVWTGLALALRRFRNWLRRGRKAEARAAEETELVSTEG